MCGIFAYRGSLDASKIVFNGLRSLQYRGYDSWGIAMLMKSGCKVIKNIGILPNKLTSLEISNLAVGHTRWATHGGVSVANSHPHISCDRRFIVVHNGIVENYKVIKSKLSSKHIYVSNTDTEILAHYLEENTPLVGLSKALKNLVSKISGHSAFVIADCKTNKIYAYRSGSPLVLGKNGQDLYISSDLPSLATQVKYIYPLSEGELLNLSLSLDNLKWIKSPIKRVRNNKSSTRYHMESEMYETVEILENYHILTEDNFRKIKPHLSIAHKIVLTGCGSSYHACLFGQYLLSKYGIITRSVVASEGESTLATIDSLTTLIVLSQSGETIDSLDYMKLAKERGAYIISLTNVPHSSLDRLADFSLDLGVGVEVAVASTKAFIFMQIFFVILASKLGKQNITLELSSFQRKLLALYHSSNKKNTENLAKKLVKVKELFIITKGDLIPLGYEAALKFKEIGYIYAENIISGELKHGPLALINKESTCLILKRENSHDLDNTISEVRAREGRVIELSLPDLGILTSVYGANYIHLVSFYHSILLGHNPDRPRNLAKSVTVK